MSVCVCVCVCVLQSFRPPQTSDLPSLISSFDYVHIPEPDGCLMFHAPCSLMLRTCEVTGLASSALIKALGYAFVESTVEKGYGKIGQAVARDFTGILVNANDYFMHAWGAMGRSSDHRVPEFRAEKVGGMDGPLFHGLMSPFI